MVGDDYEPGSQADFHRLYDRSYPRLKRTLTALLGDPHAAEDCVQDAFVRAYRVWPKWKPDAPAEAWLHRIAINIVIDSGRRQRLRKLAEPFLRAVGAEPEIDPAEAGLFTDVMAALRRLPPKLAAALVLRHYHGYDNREIAAALGVSERTIGTRVAQASARLRNDLGLEWSPAAPSGSRVLVTEVAEAHA